MNYHSYICGDNSHPYVSSTASSPSQLGAAHFQVSSSAFIHLCIADLAQFTITCAQVTWFDAKAANVTTD